MNQKFKALSIFAAVGAVALAVSGTVRAQVLEKVAFSATIYSQNGAATDNNTSTTQKAVSKQAVSTVNLIEQLVHDEFTEGNLASDTVPSGAVLNFNGMGFEIDKGTNQLVDVSDILTWNVTGTNDISGAGSFLDANGAATAPFSQTDYYLVTVSYNDSASTGKLQFSVTGVAIVTAKATAPNAKTGKFTQSGSISFSDGTGEGVFSDDGPVVLTGFTITAKGSTTVSNQ